MSGAAHLSANWDEKFRAVEESLRLYLHTEDDGTSYLLDDQVSGPENARLGRHRVESCQESRF